MRNGRTAPSGLLWLLRLGTLATALVLSAQVESAAGLQAGKQSWTTAPDYRIQDPAATDSGFGRFSRMRVGTSGCRWLLGETQRGVVVVLSSGEGPHVEDHLSAGAGEPTRPRPATRRQFLREGRFSGMEFRRRERSYVGAGVPAHCEYGRQMGSGLRRLAEDALHVPSHFPAVYAVVPTASGEVWLKTPEIADGLAVWYSIPRGESDAPPRRVMLPSTFKLHDAFADHVWGFAEEPSQPSHVLGLRLVPPSG